MKPPADAERRLHFEVLVLKALWLIVRHLAYLRRSAGGPGSHADIGATNLRADMLGYFDIFGRQDEGGKAYRRSHTFPEIGNEP